MTLLHLHGPIRWLFALHVLGGVTALLIFAIPLFSKKGGRLHVKTGWLYTAAMSVVALTAFIITPWRAFWDPARNTSSQSFAVFLFFISFFTLSALTFGLMPLKHKRRTAPSAHWLAMGLPWVLIGLSAITQLIGIYLRDPLLILFPILSYLEARGQLRYWRTAPTERMHWWYAHMNGMFNAVIATLTAFLVTAIPRLWDSGLARNPILWLAPGILLRVVLRQWLIRYRRQFGDLPQDAS